MARRNLEKEWERKKRRVARRMERKQWDRGSFLDDVSARAGEDLEKGMQKGRV